jgi:hypothetical protein
MAVIETFWLSNSPFMEEKFIYFGVLRVDFLDILQEITYPCFAIIAIIFWEILKTVVNYFFPNLT